MTSPLPAHVRDFLDDLRFATIATIVTGWFTPASVHDELEE